MGKNKSEMLHREETEHAIRHDTNFLADAKRLLERRKPVYEGALEYKLEPHAKEYLPFLSHFIETLERLPWKNEIGKTILMRSDAKDAVEKILVYLKEQRGKIVQGQPWQNAALSSVRKVFTFEGLEVFKNEIYPEMRQNSLCYSIDIGIKGSPLEKDKAIPFSIVIERFYIQGEHPEKFLARRNGQLKLFVDDGIMKINLEDGFIPPHLD